MRDGTVHEDCMAPGASMLVPVAVNLTEWAATPALGVMVVST